jgi:hypothetical protein
MKKFMNCKVQEKEKMMLMRSIVIGFVLGVVSVMCHESANPMLWECHCWDYKSNEAFKRLTQRPTPRRRTREPTFSPLPENWPEFLKHGFWDP